MKIKLKHFILKIKKFAFVTIFLLFILGSKTIYCNKIVHSKLNLDEIPKKNHLILLCHIIHPTPVAYMPSLLRLFFVDASPPSGGGLLRG
jgi:hypothetical protein